VKTSQVPQASRLAGRGALTSCCDVVLVPLASSWSRLEPSDCFLVPVGTLRPLPGVGNLSMATVGLRGCYTASPFQLLGPPGCFLVPFCALWLLPRARNLSAAIAGLCESGTASPSFSSSIFSLDKGQDFGSDPGGKGLLRRCPHPGVGC